MNRYGQLAQRHWQTHDPSRYATIPNPTEFFSILGEQAEQEIQTLAERLAGPDPAGEDYLTKVGRLNMARTQAEEQVLAETLLIPQPPSPEAGSQDDPGEVLEEDEGPDPLDVVMEAQAAMARARAEDDQTL